MAVLSILEGSRDAVARATGPAARSGLRAVVLGAALALPGAALADDGDDPCTAQAQAIVEELSAGPTGELSARERGVALAAAVRGCKAERMRIAEIAVGAAPPAGEAPAQTAGPAPPRQPAEATGFVEGLKRWLEQPVECERIRRANGRIVSRCD